MERRRLSPSSRPSEPTDPPRGEARDTALTDRSYWSRYWTRQDDLADEATPSILFHGLLEACLAGANARTAIELGGFPGRYSAYLARYLRLDVTLLDLVIEPDVVRRVEEVNGLAPGTIRAVEGDMFTWEPPHPYDFVYSLGLIEHFLDTEAALRAHVRLLADGGTLLVAVPNLRGVNGVFQRVLDRANFDTHNLACMDPGRLGGILERLGLTAVEADYHLRFGVWIQDPGSKPAWARALVRLGSLVGRAAFRLGPATSRLGSPFIYATARRA